MLWINNNDSEIWNCGIMRLKVMIRSATEMKHMVSHYSRKSSLKQPIDSQGQVIPNTIYLISSTS